MMERRNCDGSKNIHKERDEDVHHLDFMIRS
jgi:hypothetical protein